MAELLREDMAGQCSEERDEIKEEVECALTSEHFQYLKRSNRGHPALR
jgi:hypothetical protein